MEEFHNSIDMLFVRRKLPFDVSRQASLVPSLYEWRGSPCRSETWESRIGAGSAAQNAWGHEQQGALTTLRSRMLIHYYFIQCKVSWSSRRPSFSFPFLFNLRFCTAVPTPSTLSSVSETDTISQHCSLTLWQKRRNHHRLAVFVPLPLCGWIRLRFQFVVNWTPFALSQSHRTHRAPLKGFTTRLPKPLLTKLFFPVHAFSFSFLPQTSVSTSICLFILWIDFVNTNLEYNNFSFRWHIEQCANRLYWCYWQPVSRQVWWCR